MKGLQLYTVRSCMTDSISAENTIKRIAEMGYESVQLAGSIEDVELIADVCARLKMPCIGILVGIDLCENYTERLFKCARLVGASDIGISSSAKNAEMAESIIKRANAFAKIAKSEGFTFSYHNHSNEFIRTENGKTVMELFIEGFDKELIYFMPDTYWLQHGGVDVRHFIEENSDRIKLIHLKDMKRTPEGVTFAEIGQGNLYFEGIIDTAKKAGIDKFIVEQDKCDGDSLESAKISIDYLKSIGL